MKFRVELFQFRVEDGSLLCPRFVAISWFIDSMIHLNRSTMKVDPGINKTHNFYKFNSKIKYSESQDF